MLDFIFKVVTISSSGALTPGPLSAATAAIGTKKGWKGGFLVSLGHLVVEAPLIFLLAFFVSFTTVDVIIKPLAILGGVMLVFFGYMTIKSSFESKTSAKNKFNFNPFFTGVFLTALNPFFIVWWFSIGSTLVIESIILFGYFGMIFLFFSHVWIDFVWLSMIAHFTSPKVVLRFQRILLFFLGFIVIFFGIEYIYFAIFNSHIF
ncbi:MAG: LysE family transporter [Archaeoglobaceae archaeon]|nr:LysE family transporter [Archaeoglobaceae archaeon]